VLFATDLNTSTRNNVAVRSQAVISEKREREREGAGGDGGDEIR